MALVLVLPVEAQNSYGNAAPTTNTTYHSDYVWLSPTKVKFTFYTRRNCLKQNIFLDKHFPDTAYFGLYVNNKRAVSNILAFRDSIYSHPYNKCLGISDCFGNGGGNNNFEYSIFRYSGVVDFGAKHIKDTLDKLNACNVDIVFWGIYNHKTFMSNFENVVSNDDPLYGYLQVNRCFKWKAGDASPKVKMFEPYTLDNMLQVGIKQIDMGYTKGNEADSLNYLLTKPRKYPSGVFYSFVSNYSMSYYYNSYCPSGAPCAANPNAKPPRGFYLSPKTGVIKYYKPNPDNFFYPIVAVECETFKKDSNGLRVKVSSLIRINTSYGNSAPDETLNKYAYTPDFDYTYNVCEEVTDTIIFNVKDTLATKQTAKDTVKLRWVNELPNSTAVVTNLGQPEPNVKILWTPPVGSNANNPYTFNIYAYESLCSVNRRYMFRSAEFNAIPQPQFVVNIDTSLCSQLKFSATTTQTGPFKLEWLVYSKKDTIKKSGSAKDSINLPYAGKWYVKLKVQNTTYGCTKLYMDSIVPVNAAIVSNISKQKAKVCKGTNLFFSSTTFNNQGQLNYQWYQNKQLVASTANYNFIIKDTSKIKIIVSDKRNCKASDSITITTYADKLVQHLPDTAFCNNSSIAITASPTYAKDTITWLHNQQHTATQILAVANTYVIQYTDSNQCSGRDTFVLKEVTPFFIKPMQDAQLCKNDTLIFQAQLQPAISVDSMFWYKDGTRVSSATQPQISFSAPANMELKVFAKQYSKQCQANDTFNVSVYQKSDIGFDIIALDSCLPSNRFKVTKSGSGASNSLLINWGDAQSQILTTTATHAYKDTGIYQLTLYVNTANNCKDTVIKSASVYAAPIVQFTVNDLVQCANENKFILNLTSPRLGPNLHTIHWGDNVIVTQVPNNLYSHVYSKNASIVQKYTISVSSSFSNNCADTMKKIVTVYPSPAVKIKANGLCIGDTTLFTASIRNALPIKTYAWQIGNQASGNLPTIYRSFATIGTYTASVKVSTDSLCDGFDTMKLNMLERPKAAFDFEKAQRDNLATIPFYFTDRSTNANTWLWTFNSSFQTSLQNVKYDFIDTGYARVKLVVSNKNTCYDSLERLLPIMERIKFYIPNVFTPNADGNNDGFGLHSSQYFLIKTFKMEVFNRWGEIVFKTTDMTEHWHPEKDQQSIYLVKILIKDFYNINQELSGVVEVLR